jgi:DNA-binding transcriptional ArsR family regulator
MQALGHPIRRRILKELSDRGAGRSPSELDQVLGEGLSLVSYHARVLLHCGAIYLHDTEPRRGSVEHYYRRDTSAGVGRLVYRLETAVELEGYGA